MLAPPPPTSPPALVRVHQAAARPSRLLVFATEYRLDTSRRTAPPGPLIAQLKNNGQDDHDLAIRTLGGRVLAKTPLVHPGRVGQFKVKLRAGKYWLVCTVPGHEAMGMIVGFTVRAAKRKGVQRAA